MIWSARYSVRHWLADEGDSGKVPASERTQFRILRDGETLVVSKTGRIGRDALNVGATIRMLAARGIEVVVLQLGELHTNTHENP